MSDVYLAAAISDSILMGSKSTIDLVMTCTGNPNAEMKAAKTPFTRVDL